MLWGPDLNNMTEIDPGLPAEKGPKLPELTIFGHG